MNKLLKIHDPKIYSLISKEYKKILDFFGYKLNNSELNKVPFLPTKLFKEFNLRSVSKKKILKVLLSSSTTGTTPSKIHLDKENAYNQMRVANQILSSSENARMYSYEEADGYLTVVSPPPKEDYFFFEKGDIESIDNYSLQLYESHYYSLSIETPISISLTEVNGEFSFTSIVKMSGADQWIVKSGLEQNIDPKIGIEWITLIVSALGENENDWDYSLSLSDGYSEDFTFHPPYPNPSIGQSINFEFQIITEQTIVFQIVDILGQIIWEFSRHYSKPEVITMTWDGKNQSGQRVANGVYFGIMEGNSEQKVFKITYLKKSN